MYFNVGRQDCKTGSIPRNIQEREREEKGREREYEGEGHERVRDRQREGGERLRE